MVFVDVVGNVCGCVQPMGRLMAPTASSRVRSKAQKQKKWAVERCVSLSVIVYVFIFGLSSLMLCVQWQTT